ncbi:DMT family transporter [Piscinibacter aquaticus]|uniref:DMT family transporter n=1 Tax=Piscinibacter aquaticus TaxID=392597 RepID=A0A5C6TZB5_9BURK|nr:DMT family transporter [Piscinibacter aquaticus]
MNDARRAMLHMSAFALLWAVIEVMASGVLRRCSPYQVVWTRYAVHLLLMLVVWGRREPRTLWHTSRPVFQVARSLLMFGMPASWVLAMAHGVPGGTIMTIFWFSPLLILLLARAMLRERMPAWLWLATTAGCAGAVLTHEWAAPASAWALALPGSMALCFSLYVVMTRMLRNENVLANLFYTALGVFLVLTPAMPWLWVWPTAADAAVMVAVGVAGFGALWLLDRACAAAPVSLAAPFNFVQIAVFSAIAVLGGVLHLPSPRRAAAGLLLIVAATLFARWRAGRPRLDAVPSPSMPVSKES